LEALSFHGFTCNTEVSGLLGLHMRALMLLCLALDGTLSSVFESTVTVDNRLKRALPIYFLYTVRL